MSIVTTSYFQQGRTFIPNITNIGVEIAGVPNAGNPLQLFIDVHERELLICAIGITLYDEFQAELPTPTTQKWVDLLNGTNYTINSKEKRWDGLIGFSQQSVLAFFIYCEYLRNDESIYTTTGVVLPDAANSMNVDPTPKYINAHTEFIKMYQGEYDVYNTYGYHNNPNIIINYSGNMGLDYYNQNNNGLVSLYEYLQDQNTLDDSNFPNLEFKLYERENSWGL